MILVDLWLVVFGVWPLADPGHGLSLLGIVDIGLHLAGVWGVWGWLRRNRHRTFTDIVHGRRDGADR